MSDDGAGAAEVPPLADDADDAPRVLLLALGATTWAVPAERVRGVVRPVAVTPAPGAPAWALGVAAVRGAVLPVLDLAARADVAPEPAARDAWWVIVEHGGRAAALAGARVRSVEPAAVAALEPVGGEAARRGGLPVAGVARLVEQGSGGTPAPRASALDAVDGRAAAPVAGDEPPPPPIPVLDVAAVLDELLHDDGG